MKVSIFSDGKPGHLHQSRAVADVLGDDDPALVEVEVKSRLADGAARVLSGTLPLDHVLLEDLIGSAYETEGEAGGEAVICCGTTTALPALHSAFTLDVPAIGVMKPSLVPTGKFDVLIVPEHDRIPSAPNIISTPIAPSSFDPQDASQARDKCTKFWETPPEEGFWALALGGPASGYSPSFATLKRLTSELEQRAEEAGRKLTATTSRRTPGEWENFLAGRAEQAPERWLEPILVGNLGEQSFNPLPYFFRSAARLFMSEESVSMVSEAVTAGAKPVLLRLDPQLQGKRALFVQGLLDSRLSYAAGNAEDLDLVFEHSEGTIPENEPPEPAWADQLWKRVQQIQN